MKRWLLPVLFWGMLLAASLMARVFWSAETELSLAQTMAQAEGGEDAGLYALTFAAQSDLPGLEASREARSALLRMDPGNKDGSGARGAKAAQEGSAYLPVWLTLWRTLSLLGWWGFVAVWVWKQGSETSRAKRGLLGGAGALCMLLWMASLWIR